MPEKNSLDKVKLIGVLAASVSAVAAAGGLYLKFHPVTPFTPPKQACQIPDASTVAQFGLQPGTVDTMYPNACTWNAQDPEPSGPAVLGLSIRSDLGTSGDFSTPLSFGKVEESRDSTGQMCTISWPLGHGLLAQVNTFYTKYTNTPCAGPEEWATALAPKLPPDTAQ